MCGGSGGRQEAARAGGQARWLAGWGAEARAPPARSRGLLYPQQRWWRCCASSGPPPQPLLSQGRGALAGRRSGLPAPGWQSVREWSPPAVRARAALPPCGAPLTEPLGKPWASAPRLQCAVSLCLGSPLARPLWEPLVSRDHRRGDPDRASPGLSAIEGTPPAQASGGAPAVIDRNAWLGMSPAVAAWSAAAKSPLRERIWKGTAAWRPPGGAVKPLSQALIQAGR